MNRSKKLFVKFPAGLFTVIITALTALPLNSACAAEAAWTQERDKEGIRIYSRKTQEHRTSEYKGIAYIKVPMAGAIALFEDTGRTSEWMYQCKELRELPPKTPGERMFYLLQDFPAPAHQRDAAVSRIRTPGISADSVIYTYFHVPGGYPPQVNVRRMLYFKSVWKFTPAKEGGVDVEYLFQADPGGHIPVWMFDNIFSVDLPFYTLRRLRELAQEPVYQKAPLPAISTIAD